MNGQPTHEQLDCPVACELALCIGGKSAPGGCGTASDEDGDGVPDCVDQCAGMPDTDADGDGYADCIDDCRLDAMIYWLAPGDACGAECTPQSTDAVHPDPESGIRRDGSDCIPDCMQSFACDPAVQTCET
jgi:hypothetical protein